MRFVWSCLAGSPRRQSQLRPIFALLFMFCLPAFLPCALLAAMPDNSLTPSGTASRSLREATDQLLERSPAGGERSGCAIHITYPAFGDAAIDEDIKNWVNEMADGFAANLARSNDEAAEADAAIDSLLAGDTLTPLPAAENANELWGAYQATVPSSAAISIAFELWSYTGAPEANLDLITLNYSRLTGQRLELVDIFENPDIALKLMSDWSRKVLASRLGAARRSHMLANGTEPFVENFSSLTLTPEGICINFQPWQVAPSDAGVQKVTMPLKELMPAAPLLALWGKTNEQAGSDQIACLPTVQGQPD